MTNHHHESNEPIHPSNLEPTVDDGREVRTLLNGETIRCYGSDTDGCTPWENANGVDMLGNDWEKYDRRHERFVLDWDDTCKDTGKFWIQAHREVLKDFNFTDDETSDDAILALFGNIHVGNTLGIERFAKEDKDYSDDEVWGLIKGRAKELLAANPMDPLLIEALKRAKETGANLAVWSSSPREILHETIKANNLEDIFDAVVSVDDVDSDKHKPNPQGLLIALRAMDVAQGYLDEGEDYSDVKPQRMNGVWMVGDSPNDVLGGKSVGASTVWLEHPLQGHNAHEKRKNTLEQIKRKMGAHAIKDASEDLRPTVTIRTFDPEEAGYGRNTSIMDIPTDVTRKLTTVNINFVKFLVDKGLRSQLYRWEKVRDELDEQGIKAPGNPENLAATFYGDSTAEPRKFAPREVVVETDSAHAKQSLARIEAKRLDGALL